MTCTLTGWSLTKARVRPSANCTRRRIRSSSAAMSLALSSARAGWRAAISNTAVTWPCSTPWRTSVWSPRAPSASAKASSKIDLPAPVSPVSTARCPAKSMSSRSIRTMSRIESRESMAWRIRCDAPSLKTWMAGTRPVQFLAQPDLLEGPADPGTLVLGRLQAAVFHQRIGVLVPFAVGEIVPEHGGRGLCLLDDAERHIGFGQALAALEEVSRKYPTSEYAISAKQKLEVARDQLAGKEMQIGRYYLTKKDYTGAINRFKVVVTRYQTTRHVEEALERLTEAYMSLGIVEEAQTAAAVLGHNFPDSEWYKHAYSLVKNGGLEPAENKGSWISRAFKKVGLG